MQDPVLSIITIHFNRKSDLEATFDSVLSQTARDRFEYVVIDGGSTDGSAEQILARQEQLDYWVSEPDAGIYHAMNKGIRAAKGQYLLFLNAGDTLCTPQVIEKAWPEIQEGAADIVSFAVQIEQTYGGCETYLPPIHPTFVHFVQNSLPHPSTFIRRDLFFRYGLYDETLKIASDWKFFVEVICRHRASYKACPLPLSVFQNDGISSNPKFKQVWQKEKEQVLKNDFPAFYEDALELIRYRKRWSFVNGGFFLKKMRELNKRIKGAVRKKKGPF